MAGSKRVLLTKGVRKNFIVQRSLVLLFVSLLTPKQMKQRIVPDHRLFIFFVMIYFHNNLRFLCGLFIFYLTISNNKL